MHPALHLELMLTIVYRHTSWEYSFSYHFYLPINQRHNQRNYPGSDQQHHLISLVSRSTLAGQNA